MRRVPKAHMHGGFVTKSKLMGLQVVLVEKNLPAHAGDVRDCVEKIPWKGAWKPTPVFLPGESHGQRSLVGYSPSSCKESDTTD